MGRFANVLGVLRSGSRSRRHTTARRRSLAAVGAIVATTFVACSDDDSDDAASEPVCDESAVIETVEEALSETADVADDQNGMRLSALVAAPRVYDLGEGANGEPRWERPCGIPDPFLLDFVVLRFLINSDDAVREQFEVYEVPAGVWLIAEDLTDRYFEASTSDARSDIEALSYALTTELHELADLYDELDSGHRRVDPDVAHAATVIDREVVENLAQGLDTFTARFESRWISYDEEVRFS